MVLMSQLLDEALALDDAGRRAWLERLSRENQDLASALRAALLPEAAEAVRVDALMTLPKLGSPNGALSANGLKPGAHVGPYELIRPLGSGGMAEVWLARRADGAFKREVALKLPTLTHLRADLEQRFACERDILASLEHPQIARFYDAGIDPNGLPYVAMEYVHGEPLTSWCNARLVGISARLELLVQVLGATQYAHEKHVVHRDLKPSNILVTESGQVRLLDFGVAKLLEAEEANQTPLTRVYGRALTPDYASPELLRGDRVDARSDIYSLGVVLYELLTGIRPYQLKSAASMGLLEQAIATVDVKKPSTQIEQAAAATRATTEEQLARELRGDLDAIALKALAKEPAERYPSAAALAEDLQRYLEGKPIKALPARITYRVRKFVLRNRTVVGVSATAIAAILATFGYTLYRETVTQVKIASNEVAVLQDAIPEKSIAVLPFVNMSSDKEQEYFADGLAEELRDLLAKIEGFHVIARTSSFSFKGKSEDIPTIAKKLNVANILEGSVRKSGNRLRVTTQLVRANTGAHIWSETYDRELKDIFQVQDEIAGAVVTALKLKLAPGPKVTNSHRTSNTEAYNQYLLGRQFSRRGSVDDERRAVEAFRKAIQLDPHYAAAYAALAISEDWVAVLTGDGAGEQQALAVAEKAVVLAPNEAEGYGARGALRSTISWDWTGAQADLEKALALDPGDSGVQRRYGSLLASLGRLPEAIAMTKKAIELDPLSGASWHTLSLYLMAATQFGAAREAIRRSREIAPEDVTNILNLGILQLHEGQAAEALATFRKIDFYGFRLPGIAMAEHTLGHVKESQQALDQLIAKHPQDSAYYIVGVYAWRGEKDKAFEWLDRAYQQRDRILYLIKLDPAMASLRGDARFGAMLRKLKLPE